MTTQVILLQPVKNLGAEGDKVAVANGYARNYLLPQRLATLATLANVKQLDKLKERRAAREADELKTFQTVADKIAKLTLSIPVATGPGGKLFGAVTSLHIAEALAAQGVQIDHHSIEMKQAHHALGTFDVDIKLHAQVTANLKFSIVSKAAPGAQEAADAAAEEKARGKRPRPERGRGRSAEKAVPAKEARSAAEGKPARAQADEKKSERRKEKKP